MFDTSETGQAEPAIPAANARVLWSAKDVSPEQVLRAAVFSLCQVQPNEVNGPITTTSSQRPTFRPQGYGRAALVNCSHDRPHHEWDMQSDLILDVKGCGVSNDTRPRAAHHATGLLTLVEGIQEVLMEGIVHTLLEHVDLELKTARPKALVDPSVVGMCPPEYGFPKPQPAVLLMRETHKRPSNALAGTEDHEKSRNTLYLELWLRKLGLSTTKRAFSFHLKRHAYGLRVTRVQKSFDVAKDHPAFAEMNNLIPVGATGAFAVYPNVQLTCDSQLDGIPRIIDFGHFNFLTHPNDPIVLRLWDAPFEWGPSMGPDNPAWPKAGTHQTALCDRLALSFEQSAECLQSYDLPPEICLLYTSPSPRDRG